MSENKLNRLYINTSQGLVKICKCGTSGGTGGGGGDTGSGEGDNPSTDLKIVTFADGTDEELQAMLDAHYNGNIDIADYWSVGDERTIHLNAVETPVNSNFKDIPAQDMIINIIGIEHDDLVAPINNRSKAAITIQCKHGIKPSEPMYYEAYNAATSPWNYWLGSDAYIWCRTIFGSTTYNIGVVLPNFFVKNLKTIVKLYYDDINSEFTNAGFSSFLLSYSEVFGGEAEVGTSIYAKEGLQYEYYKTESNRLKTLYNESNGINWWLRTRFYNNAFYCVKSNGTSSGYTRISPYSMCPAFCL